METEERIVWRRPGLRVRYRARAPICGGLVARPWVSAALLVMGYLFLTSPYVLQPGVIVRLPASPFKSGTPYGHRLAVLSQETATPHVRQEIVFFEDERFLAADSAEMERLRSALAKAHREKPQAPLIVEADERVAHGTIVALFNMAADSGIEAVNLATRPPP